jgi:phage terminase small subunit
MGAAAAGHSPVVRDSKGSVTTPLTNDAHERFCQEYLVDLNATAAYQRAYPKATRKSARTAGPRLLANVGISDRVAALQEKRSERVEITQDYVLTWLRKNLKRAMQAEPVLDRDGNETGEYVYAGAVANGALALLGKHIGMFSEKHEHTGKDGGPIEYQNLTAVERATRVQRILDVARTRKASNGNGKHG